MLLFVAIGFLSLIALYLGSNLFVQGAAQGALHARLPKLLVGLVLVSFATSAPELFTSIGASLQGRMDTAVGNVIGSNIANIALVFAVLILLRPMAIDLTAEKTSGLFLLAAGVFLPLATWDGWIGRWEGAFFAAGLAVFLFYMYREGAKHAHPDREEVLEHVIEAHLSPARAAAAFLGGLALLAVATQGLLWSAIGVARLYGVSDLVIGLTVVAVGTSLPELATSVAGVLKKETDLALGNIIGSNIFNVFGVIGASALTAPGPVSAAVTQRDAPVALLVVLIAAALIAARRGAPVGGREGGILLACFVGYQYLLYLATFHHGA